jgi:hypothetical protein
MSRQPFLYCFALLLFSSPFADGQSFLFNRSDFATGNDPGGIVMADFNGDGRLDVAVTDGTYGTLTILLGQASGTFAQHGASYEQSSAGAVVAGDFNGDGKIDLVVADWLGSSVSVYLGKGNGSFTKVSTSPVNYYASAIAVGDFNKDGKLDIAVTSNSAYGVSVLLGNGDGSFVPYILYSTPSYTIGIVTADFNGDGNIDLAMADTYGNDAYVMLGKGDGAFHPGASFPAGEVPVELAVGDFNGDGILDLAVSDGPDGPPSMSILPGKGDGTFGAPNTFSTEGAGPVVLQDFNHDGKLDLALGEFGPVAVYLGKGDGTFQPNVDYGSDGDASELVAGDFNRDGLIDLVVTNFNGNNATHVSTLLGNGDGTFGTGATYGTGETPAGLVTADFNGDKKADLATINIYDSTVSVLLGTGGGKFGPAASYPVSGVNGSQYGAIAAADFNGDGFPDIATANYSAGTVSILLNHGNGTFGSYKDYAAGSNADAVVAADFNKDGKMDLVAGNAGVGFSLLLGKGNGEFAAPVAFGTGLSPYSIVVGDFNRDGNPDLATVSGSLFGNSVAVLLGTGDGTFGLPVTYSTGTGALAVVAGDFNKDGKTDLAVLTTFLLNVDILLGNGDGTFQTSVPYPAPRNPTKLLSGDFRGKGILDLAMVSSNTWVEILPGNGSGGFGGAVPYYLGNDPLALVAADFDGNGSTDLAATNNYAMGSVTVLLNKPVVALASSALVFPATVVGTKSPAQTATLSNLGTVVVSIRSISISGANPSDFAWKNNCNTTLAVGKMCTVSIVFQPSQRGERSATLKFADNALSGGQSIRLVGTGK